MNQLARGGVVALSIALASLHSVSIPAAKAADPKPTPCNYRNKVRSSPFTLAEWNKQVEMFEKFVRGYIKEKEEYDRSFLVGEDKRDLKGSQREKYFDDRKYTVDQTYRWRLEREDPEFYRAIQNGPEGWYTSEKDKEIFRSVFWDYLTFIGWYEVSIENYAIGDSDADKDSILNQGSLKMAITEAQGWSNGGSREAASIKKLTVNGLKVVKADLINYTKELGRLVCPGAWYLSWVQSIHDKAWQRYSVAMDAYRNNIEVLKNAIESSRQEEDERALRRIHSDPNWRYLADFFSVYRTVGPNGFSCTWGFRGEFDCTQEGPYGTKFYGRGPQR